MNFKIQIAQDLLQIKAIKLKTNSYFTWASGINSPIYCDNRIALGHPEVRTHIIKGFEELVKEYSDTNLVAGVATAGIPHAAMVADHVQLPMCYIRSSAKGHGRQNKIEGDVKGNEKAVVIEDLISTGGSSITAANDLKETGVDIQAVLAIFTYGFPIAEKNFKENNLSLKTLTNFETLLEVAKDQNYITSDESHLLMKFANDPQNWTTE